MRPALGRAILRSDTSYHLGRTTVDICIAVLLLGLLSAPVLFYKSGILAVYPQPAVVLLVLHWILFCALAIAGRELAQALFDIADAHMAQHRLDETREASDAPVNLFR